MNEAEAAAAGAARFTLLDWSVVLIYLLIVMAIGLWASRGQKTTRDYFLGGRTIPWWVVGLSIVATETSALTFIGIPAMVIGGVVFNPEEGFSFTGGSMLFMMVVLGHLIGRIIIASWIVPYYFKGDVYTTYQLLARAFGLPARMTAAGISFIAAGLGAGTRVLVTAIPIMLILQTYDLTAGWGIIHAILLIMIFALVYTAFGGIKAVVWTDMMQYFIFVGGGLFALFYIPTLLSGTHAAPSGAEGWSAIGEIAGSFVSDEQRGITPLTWFRAGFNEMFTGPFNLIMGLIAVPIGIVFALGFEQFNVQRVLTCRNVADGRKAVILSACLIGPQFLMFLLIGASLFTYYVADGFNFSIMPWDPAKAAGGVGSPRADFVFPIFILEHMPIFVKGFLVAGILAAAMSSVSSSLGAMASIVVMDFYRPLSGGRSKPATDMWLSRASVVVAGILLTAVAYLSSLVDQRLFDLAFTLAGITAGGLLGPFIWGLVFKRGHFVPVVSGMIISVFFMLLFNFGHRVGLLDPEGPVRSTFAEINWTWHAPIGTAISLLVIALLTPLFPSPKDRSINDEEVLDGTEEELEEKSGP